MKWNELFSDQELAFHDCLKAVLARTPSGKLCPKDEFILKAFNYCTIEQIKVVWIGQDPYHDGKATGLCMGVIGKPIPPTLRILNIALNEEYKRDISDYSLEHWAKQGVLLLNAALTVERGKPGSHTEIWRTFTVNILQKINVARKDVVWVALGKVAQSYLSEVPDIPDDNIVSAPHPMVAIYGGDISKFTGHKIYTRINEKLGDLGHSSIQF